MAKAKPATSKTDFPHGANELATLQTPGDRLTTYLEGQKTLAELEAQVGDKRRELQLLADQLRELPELRTLLVVQQEAPAAAPAAPAVRKPAKGTATKTTRGAAEGTWPERILAALTKKPITNKELHIKLGVETEGQKASCSTQANKLAAEGKIQRVQEEGKREVSWRLA